MTINGQKATVKGQDDTPVLFFDILILRGEVMEKISEYFVSNLFGAIIKSKEQKEIYTYGLTLLLTTMLGMISILSVSAVLGAFAQGVLFLIVFSLLRVHTGGYHCKTYAKCFVVSNIIFLIVFMIYKVVLLLSLPAIVLIDFALLGISWLYIFRNAPVLTKDHKLPQKRILKNRRKAITVSGVISITGCICTFILIWTNNTLLLHYCTITAITEAAVSVLMLILRIKERRNQNA